LVDARVRRYTQFDAPYFQRAFGEAGATPGEVVIQLARGGAEGELKAAESDLARGAAVTSSTR
jgi:hypothetical protein